MSTATVVGWLLQAATVALAFLVARKRPQHWPFTVWAAVVLVVDVARMYSTVPFPWLLEKGPFYGTQRLIFATDQAVFLVEPVGLAMISWRTFLYRRPHLPLGAGVIAWLALALAYPELRGEPLARAYALIHAAAIVASLVAIGIWTRRRAQPRTEHAAASLAVVISIALYDGPYSPSVALPFWSWETAEKIFLGLWAGQALLHALALWRGGFGFEATGARERSPRLH